MKRAALLLLLLPACSPAPPTPVSAPPPVLVEAPTGNHHEQASADDDPRPPPAPRVRRHTVAIGYFGHCAIDEGKLYCWAGHTGQRASGSIRASVTPLSIDEAVVSVAVSDHHGCATTEPGHVYCWGDNSWGQLGAMLADVSSVEPTRVVDLSDALAVAVGSGHSCALRKGGRVSCWGTNRAAQAGHHTAYTVDAHRLVRPIEVAGIVDAVSLVCGDSYSCVLRSDNHLLCWGTGPRLTRSYANERVAPEQIDALEDATHIAARGEYGCAVLKDHRVRCWGWNYNGRLGHAGGAPGPVDDLSDAIDITLGTAHACVRRQDGKVACWGQYGDGQLGRALDPAIRGAGDSRVLAVAGLSGVVEIAAGVATSCARTFDDELFCWGRSPWQQGDAKLFRPELMKLH